MATFFAKNYQSWWIFDKVKPKTILTVFLRHGVNPLNGSSRVHECDMARHTDHGVKICIAIGGIVYTCKRGTNREQIKRLPMTSRENI